ncbi:MULTISPECIES: ABC transporter permease [Salinivibrio]|jgi:amino acid ABC transporter membrane protein 2, PAAT family (TC 3.A.1.3.-)|uniref:Arginine ABC transporter permease protein ArtM n=1 Tax=Salinivibrio costicola subsp. alcaliphilus TaxID=272773 RepID=A0ABX3KPI8_SALCS|nr:MULTISPECIES: ABC transporter permease [Salinivibrio]NUY57193.1 ABC transporter permease [Salinivibrio sp. EAGSL]OOE93693.1 amino acid ABC transporter permease [Salinivibrio sp. AR647]OOE95935.1 amino acid ABC transporter permease [Salinivibrio sp. AR640]OOE96520.1 amino acid ABC transporter permease [Salinivibrio sp. IB643]OOE98645.1 amino acid ABC transporter permease [Salinivibrio sp. MA351]
MDFSLVLETWPIYLDGLWTTVWLVASALVIGLLVAVPVAVARNAQFPLWRYPAWAFIYFFRGTPLLIQLYLIYYGLSQVVNVEDSLWQHAWFCALVAFVLNTAAYTAEIIRGAINGLPKGEVEAAIAYGMSPYKAFSRIILPSAMRRALPAYSNEVVFMLHGSAVAGIITIVDLTGAARIVNSRYYAPFESFLTAGVFYMALTFSILWMFRLAERRFLRHMRPLS